MLTAAGRMGSPIELVLLFFQALNRPSGEITHASSFTVESGESAAAGLTQNTVKHVSNLARQTKQFFESFAYEEQDTANAQAIHASDASRASVSNASNEDVHKASLLVSQVRCSGWSHTIGNTPSSAFLPSVIACTACLQALKGRQAGDLSKLDSIWGHLYDSLVWERITHVVTIVYLGLTIFEVPAWCMARAQGVRSPIRHHRRDSAQPRGRVAVLDWVWAFRRRCPSAFAAYDYAQHYVPVPPPLAVERTAAGLSDPPHPILLRRTSRLVRRYRRGPPHSSRT